MIRIQNKLILFIFGWGVFPSYVNAKPRVWWRWLLHTPRR